VGCAARISFLLSLLKNRKTKEGKKKMKKMIYAVIGLISVLSAPAFADMKCIAHGEAGTPTVSLEFHGSGQYTVSIYGHSRSTYAAIYERDVSAGYPYLKKAFDRSTHKDMPNQLQLSWGDVITEPGIVYKLIGLPRLGALQFSQIENCFSN
jgi:hypothetical protein